MKRFILAATLACTATAAQADAYGLLGGRTADIQSEPQTTIEAGFSTQDDFSAFGGRFNFKLSPNSLYFATIANLDADAGDENIAFGGGLVYQFNQQNSNGFNAAVRGSYHLWNTEGIFGTETDFSDFGLELIISPKAQTVAQGVDIYAMFGFHRLTREFETGLFRTSSDTDTEFSLGAGANFSIGPGKAYVALEIIDETFLGFGYRLALGQ